MLHSPPNLDGKRSRVMGLADEYEAGFTDSPHSHEMIQLLYASSGVMSVITDHESFIIPPQRAVWIPDGIIHEVSCRGSVSLRTLYINAEYQRGEKSCHIVEVSPFLQALIVEVTQFVWRESPTKREEGIVDLLLEEILSAPNIPYTAPMPTDPRLVRVCKAIVNNPSDRKDINDFAEIACMSRRSLTRAFKKETGMGVAVWRQQVRLLEALSLISTGASVTSAALDVGYESASAFSTMFQQAFGVSPSKYPF
ncbi:MAG: AraC family transcriptional regulator [Alphaproteobacteria bacterium]